MANTMAPICERPEPKPTDPIVAGGNVGVGERGNVKGRLPISSCALPADEDTGRAQGNQHSAALWEVSAAMCESDGDGNHNNTDQAMTCANSSCADTSSITSSEPPAHLVTDLSAIEAGTLDQLMARVSLMESMMHGT